MFDNSSKPKSILDKCAPPEVWPEKPRHAGALAGVCVLLTLALAGAVWYAVPKLKRHDALLTETVGVKQSLQTLDGRLDQQNSKLVQWSSSQEALEHQIADLRREMRSRIAAVKKQSGQSAEALFRRVEGDIGGQIDAIKSKVAGLESSRDADQAQIAALQNQLSQVREEMAAQKKEFMDRLAENGSATAKELAVLEASQDEGRKEVAAISRKIGVRRIDFEVTKGHNTELVPGITLNVSGTDIAYRRVSGWMWVLPDRRTIWLRGQGAQEPVAFYSNADGMKRELVITSVTKSSAVGYLLVPEEGNPAESASAPSAAPDPAAAE